MRQIQSESGFSEKEVLRYAAYCESFSNHPIALSIQKAYGAEVDKDTVNSYEEIAGHGTRIEWNGEKVLAGNRKLMEKEKICFPQTDTADTVVYVAVDGKLAGRILIADKIKADTKQAIEKLKKSGIRKTVMLTGDSRKVAETVGREVGIDEIKSGDIVTVFGKDGGEEISAEELAALSGTIHYELICLIGKRVPRIYQKSGKTVGSLNYINP